MLYNTIYSKIHNKHMIPNGYCKNQGLFSIQNSKSCTMMIMTYPIKYTNCTSFEKLEYYFDFPMFQKCKTYCERFDFLM